MPLKRPLDAAELIFIDNVLRAQREIDHLYGSLIPMGLPSLEEARKTVRHALYALMEHAAKPAWTEDATEKAA